MESLVLFKDLIVVLLLFKELIVVLLLPLTVTTISSVNVNML